MLKKQCHYILVIQVLVRDNSKKRSTHAGRPFLLELEGVEYR